MASNSKLRLSTEGMENLIAHFNKLGADVAKAAEHALNTAADKVLKDTREALKKPSLPAQGKYSQSNSQYASAAEVLEKSKVMTVGTQKEIEGPGRDSQGRPCQIHPFFITLARGKLPIRRIAKS